MTGATGQTTDQVGLVTGYMMAVAARRSPLACVLQARVQRSLDDQRSIHKRRLHLPPRNCVRDVGIGAGGAVPSLPPWPNAGWHGESSGATADRQEVPLPVTTATTLQTNGTSAHFLRPSSSHSHTQQRSLLDQLSNRQLQLTCALRRYESRTGRSEGIGIELLCGHDSQLCTISL
ncbi:hypothetical protein GQ600_2373 [Phytophthora cactorum]|nr:hypothetical protein GQ600_2373 [Phytophthora cactorum]